MSKLTPEAIDSLLKAQTQHHAAATSIRDLLLAIREVTRDKCVVLRGDLGRDHIQDIAENVANEANDRLCAIVIHEAQSRIAGLCQSLTDETTEFLVLLSQWFPVLKEKEPAVANFQPRRLLLKILKWLANNETGASAETMAYCAAGVLDPESLRWHPVDSDDLARCIGLVEAVPEIEDKFSSISELSSEWEVIIRHWHNLVSTYQEDRRVGKGFARTNRALRSLLTEARINAVDRQKDA